jgi:hypothetical protein
MSASEIFPGSLGTLQLQHIVAKWTHEGFLSWTTLSVAVAGILVYGVLLAVYRCMTGIMSCIRLALANSLDSDVVAPGEHSGAKDCRYATDRPLVLSMPLLRLTVCHRSAATYWYEIYYDVWLGGQYFKKIAEMHERYGIDPSLESFRALP